MTLSPEEAGRLTSEVYRSAMDEVLGRAPGIERDLQRIWEPMETDLRRELATARPRDVEKIIRRHVDQMMAAAVGPIAEGITAASVLGASVLPEQWAVMVEASGPAWRAAIEAGLMPEALAALPGPDAVALAAERLAGGLTVDGLSLSARLHGHSASISRDAARVIESNLRTRQGMNQITAELRRNPLIARGDRIAQYQRELIEAAREAVQSGDRRAWREMIRSFDRRWQKLDAVTDPTTLRHAARRLADQLDAAVGAMDQRLLDHAVDRFIIERRDFRAATIARHESVESYRNAYREHVTREASARPTKAIRGVRWELSPLHPRPDECDALAETAGSPGYPEGVYPVDMVPLTPHTNCLCSQSAYIDEQFGERLLAEAEGTPEPPRSWEGHDIEADPNAWLRSLSEERRRAIVGPTRADLVMDGVNVLDPRSRQPYRVRDLLRR